MPLSENYRSIIESAIKANHQRTFFAQYPEHPKAYGEEAPVKGKESFEAQLNNPFSELLQENPAAWIGEENSPYTGQALGVTYPAFSVEALLEKAYKSWHGWKTASAEDRAQVLTDALEGIKNRFFEIAYATQHTTGQAFMMSFQASGPHSNDRALEALAMGFEELTRFPSKIIWEKPMGKFNLNLEKEFKPVPKGINLVIGCSTFPVWNSVPGIFAGLITGNPVILKPHPGAVLPIAIVVAEIQKSLKNAGFDPHLMQLAVDSSNNLITKQLAEHPAVKLIDYTGGSAFGSYVESLPGKTVFTEKAGVNSVILDSVNNLNDVLQNLAFSVSLYSGQMCTAPQNFFIPEGGVKTSDGVISYEEIVEQFKQQVAGLAGHPKMGAGTLGAIQNPATIDRVKSAGTLGAKVALEPVAVQNEEFPSARVCAPLILEVDATHAHIYEQELFGPVVVIIKTKNTAHSIALAKDLGSKHGAITCAAYSTDAGMIADIKQAMEDVFVPVSLNLTGFIWVNQHAAFSDFHVTGGNPAGNASFTNPDFVNKRFVWVGHRTIAQ